MSRAALLQLSGAAKSGKQQSSFLRVSQPGDSFETEADRVADTVARGGRVSGWSLSASAFDGVYRQSAPAPAPSAGDIAGKVAEAILATPAGKEAVAKVTAAATTPAGLVVTGAAAIGIVTAMDKAKKPLPAQAPAIPLDFVKPGLSVKITWTGPVNQPTGGSISLSFTPKAAAQKTEQPKSGNAALAADLDKVKAGLHTPIGPGLGPVQTAEQQMFDSWRMNRLRAITDFSKPKPDAVPAAAGPPAAPAPAEKLPPAAAPKAEEKKHEEIPVHRKAEPSRSQNTGSAELDSVLQSSGQPLDRATRRDMETRIGYDFSLVRLHTDARAAASAQSISAQAYTVGSDVVFAPGRFAPQTSAGRRLLAHELTHVVQQTTSPQRAHPVLRPTPSQVQRAWSGMDLPGASWLIEKVRGIKGYKLLCTVVGHDLFDDSQAYVSNAETITQGILELIPGGQQLYAKLQNAGKAIQKAYDWLVDAFRQRNLTPEGIYAVLDKAVHAFSGWHPIDSGEAVMQIVRGPIDQLIDLAGAIGRKVLDFILEGVVATFGETGQKVWAFFQRAGDVISRIAANPLQFGMNLLKALGEGVKNFFANIWEHLSTGVKEWIFQELKLPNDIKMPADFTLGSMLKLLLQVLGLTWEHRRPQLVEKLQPLGGETVVYFFETIADKAGDVIKRIREHGFSAIKEMIVEEAGSIFNSFVDNIKSWITKEFITQGLKLIAELSNPAGEIIKVVESIIETVMFVIDKAKQLAELVKTVVDALSDIVEGKTGRAAGKVEETLTRSIPLLLRFIAGQFHLTGIGKEIREIIQKIRDPIDKLIARLLDGIVAKITPLWEKGKAAFTARLGAIKEWWTKPAKFDFGDEEHELVVEGEGEKPEVYVHSARTRLRDFLEDHKANQTQKNRAKELAKGLNWKIGKEDSLAKQEAGYKNFIELQKLMSQLRSKFPKKSKVNDDKPVSALGSAVSANAFLTPDLLTGSAPNKSADPDAWNDLDLLLPPAEPHYVRGHLISEKLGGRGEWSNMMPLTNQANGNMERDVESALKEETANKKNRQYYFYEVKATYRAVKLPGALDEKANKKIRLERSLLAQKRLVRLDWTVKDAVPDDNGDGFKVTNETPKKADGKTALPKEVRTGHVIANET